MKNVNYVWLAAALILMCGAGAPAMAKDDAAPAARAVIEQLTKQVLVVLRDPQLSKSERRAKVEQIAYDQMDFLTLSRLTLGRYWRDLDDTQRNAFVVEFKKHLTATYGHTTDEYTDEDVSLTGDRQEPDGDATVLTRVVGTNDKGVRQEVAKVSYRLRHKDDHWKIIDVTIEGVSLVANFRAQFQDLMANGGFDKLLKLLHDKNAAAGL